ncbi:DUF3311 domain-containing protein [Yinghuangia seranimata]|uniref:DUF3311 domain-containing protein n=1 Tax=Yinghuangia seranimata TaxID=408067 RepID=UPI00248C375D|nr:DUF3311 domain-containing protein [Yinghuangia seranimata]MDI2131677.1 DUF3311 domain-containing protein [Yinghuangia seranimata]
MRGGDRSSGGGPARLRLRRITAGLCLALPVAALLWVPSYARGGPELGGVPFFYWYQFAWIPVCTVAMAAAYWLLRPRSAYET